MKKKILLAVCVFIGGNLLAQTPIKYRVDVLTGMLFSNKQTNRAIERPIFGGEIGVEFLPTGKKSFLQQYNNTSIGLGVTYLNLGNDKVLGSAVAAYPYLHIPLVNKPHFILGLKPGVGISLVNKRYNNTVPPEQMDKPGSIQLEGVNSAIGSILNVYFTGAVSFEVPIAKGISIAGSAGWNHISNGSTLTPNSGYNMFNGQLGLKYFPNYENYNQPPLKRCETTKHITEKRSISFDITAAGGFRELYYVDNQMYGIASLTIATHYRLVDIFRLGLGVDAFYDGVFGAVHKDFATGNDKVTYYAKTYITAYEPKNMFRVGVSLQPELIFGKLIAGVHIGVYLYDPIKNLEPYAEAKEAANQGKHLQRGIFYKYEDPSNKQDGWLYTRVVAKYLITPHFFVSVGLKTHLQKAEFIEWGAGVRL